MTQTIVSRTELAANLARDGFFPESIDMGNGRVVHSTKFYVDATGRKMVADCKLHGRGGFYGAGQWTWFARLD